MGTALIWLGGLLMVVVAGGWPVLLARRRTGRRRRSAAEFTARAAIATAQLSRDGSVFHDPVADELLARAELLIASTGGPDAADRAAELARQAERRWTE